MLSVLRNGASACPSPPNALRSPYASESGNLPIDIIR